MPFQKTFDIYYYHYYRYFTFTDCQQRKSFHIILAKKANKNQPKKGKNYIFVYRRKCFFFFLLCFELQELACGKVK